MARSFKATLDMSRAAAPSMCMPVRSASRAMLTSPQDGGRALSSGALALASKYISSCTSVCHAGRAAGGWATAAIDDGAGTESRTGAGLGIGGRRAAVESGSGGGRDSVTLCRPRVGAHGRPHTLPARHPVLAGSAALYPRSTRYLHGCACAA